MVGADEDFAIKEGAFNSSDSCNEPIVVSSVRRTPIGSDAGAIDASFASVVVGGDGADSLVVGGDGADSLATFSDPIWSDRILPTAFPPIFCPSVEGRPPVGSDAWTICSSDEVVEGRGADLPTASSDPVVGYKN